VIALLRRLEGKVDACRFGTPNRGDALRIRKSKLWPPALRRGRRRDRSTTKAGGYLASRAIDRRNRLAVAKATR
jgi:hypothetical protein